MWKVEYNTWCSNGWVLWGKFRSKREAKKRAEETKRECKGMTWYYRIRPLKRRKP